MGFISAKGEQKKKKKKKHGHAYGLRRQDVTGSEKKKNKNSKRGTTIKVKVKFPMLSRIQPKIFDRRSWIGGGEGGGPAGTQRKILQV